MRYIDEYKCTHSYNIPLPKSQLDVSILPYSRVFIVILTYWVGFLVGFGFSYTVCIPRRCYGYILLAYIIGQLSYPRCRHTIRLLLATPN